MLQCGMYLDPTVSILTIHVKAKMTWQYTDSDICIQIPFTFMLQMRFLNVLYNNAVNC